MLVFYYPIQFMNVVLFLGQSQNTHGFDIHSQWISPLSFTPILSKIKYSLLIWPHSEIDKMLERIQLKVDVLIV